MARKIAVNLLFDADQLDRLDEAAARARMSRSEWVRAAVDEKLAGQPALDLPEGNRA